MPRKTHYSQEDNWNAGYAFGTYAGSSDEELDYGEQDEAAREIYESLEGCSPEEGEDSEHCRLVGDYGTFSEGFSAGYTSEYERRHR